MSIPWSLAVAFCSWSWPVHGLCEVCIFGEWESLFWIEFVHGLRPEYVLGSKQGRAGIFVLFWTGAEWFKMLLVMLRLVCMPLQIIGICSGLWELKSWNLNNILGASFCSRMRLTDPIKARTSLGNSYCWEGHWSTSQAHSPDRAAILYPTMARKGWYIACKISHLLEHPCFSF